MQGTYSTCWPTVSTASDVNGYNLQGAYSKQIVDYSGVNGHNLQCAYSCRRVK